MITGPRRAAGLMAAAVLLSAPLLVWAGAQGETTGASGKPMEISWLIRLVDAKEKSWFMQEVEKRFNVTIVPNGINTDDTEKIGVMLAAGEFPDVGFLGGSTSALYFQQGVTRTVPVAAIKSNMPNYVKMMADYPIAWVMDKVAGKEEMYNLHGLGGHNDSSVYFVGTRLDWIRKMGMDLPNWDKLSYRLDSVGRNYFYDGELTLDWLEKLLMAYRDKDPNGNGKNDTIPFGASKDYGRSWTPIMGAFGYAPGYNVESDGKAVEWAIYPGHRDFLKTMARWYANGLIDKEFPTLDITKGWDKVANGLVGAAEVQVSYATAGKQEIPGYATRPPNTFIKDSEIGQPDKVTVTLANLRGPTGKRGNWVKAAVGPVSQYKFHFNAKLPDSKMIKVMQILDWAVYDGDDSFVGWTSGKAGVHFDWAGEPYQSLPIARDPSKVPAGYPKQGGFGTVYPTVYTPDRLKYIQTKDLAKFFQSVLYSQRYKDMGIRPYRYDFMNETDYPKLLTKYGSTLQTITDEFFFKSITGEINVDAEWDNYVSRWRKSGGDEILAAYAKMPLVKEMMAGKVAY